MFLWWQPPPHTVHVFYTVMSITFNLLYTAIMLLPPNISLQVTPPFPSVWTPFAPEHSGHIYCLCSDCYQSLHCANNTLPHCTFYIRLLRQQKFLSCLTTGALFRHYEHYTRIRSLDIITSVISLKLRASSFCHRR